MNIPLNLPAFLQGVEWSETKAEASIDGVPHATHSGVMELFGHRLRCYRLNDGRAIIDADDLQAFLGDWFGGSE